MLHALSAELRQEVSANARLHLQIDGVPAVLNTGQKNQQRMAELWAP
jgi:hypothetical protein